MWYFMCRSGSYWCSSILEGLRKMASPEIEIKASKVEICQQLSHYGNNNEEFLKASGHLMIPELIVMAQKQSTNPWNIIAKLHLPKQNPGFRRKTHGYSFWGYKWLLFTWVSLNLAPLSECYTAILKTLLQLLHRI